MEKNLKPLKPKNSQQNQNNKRKIIHKEHEEQPQIETTEIKLSTRDQLWNALTQALIRRSPERVLLQHLSKFADNEFLQSALSFHKKNASSYFLEQDSGIHSALLQRLEMVRENDSIYPLFQTTTSTPQTEIELQKRFPELQSDLELITSCSRVKMIANQTETILIAWHAENSPEEILTIETQLEKMKILFQKIIDTKNREFLANEVAAQSQAKKIPAFKVLSILTIDK